MTAPLRLVDPDDAALNAAFLLHVCGQDIAPMQAANPQLTFEIPPFTTSADAVLPHLEKWRADANWHPQYKTWMVTIRPTIHHPKDTLNNLGEATTFAKAAVLSLLRAHGVSVEFTK